ncbi:unnamed protein product [Arctogadus glacialis]
MCYSNAPRRSPTPGTRCQSWALCLPRLGACQGPTMAPRPATGGDVTAMPLGQVLQGMQLHNGDGGMHVGRRACEGREDGTKRRSSWLAEPARHWTAHTLTLCGTPRCGGDRRRLARHRGQMGLLSGRPCGSPAEPSVIQIRWSRSHEELLDPVRLVPAQEVPCWAGPAEHINRPTPTPHPHTPFSTSGSESQTGSDMSTRLPLSSRGAISYFPTQVCHRSSLCENKDRHFALLIVFKRCDL